MARKPKCEHLLAAEPFEKAEGTVCKECEKTGSSWVHLRKCEECGGIHCCDSSSNKHATAHYKETGHKVVTSAEPGEYWAWCYEDEAFTPYKA